MIHRFTNNGVFIVLDVYSGAVHVVDPVVYDIIGLYESNNEENIKKELSKEYEIIQIEEALQEVKELIDNKLLFTEDNGQDVISKFYDRKPVVKALCLHIAHDCNLRCKYCFASEGEYHGGRALMSLEVGKKAIDFLIKNSGSRHNLEIDFFGGEPLMNFEVVKEIVYYAKSKEKEYNKNFRFTITTNGVLLNDDIQQFINEHMYNVVLSIDGRKEIHDKMRPAPNGKGSYDVIMPKFKKIADSRGQKGYFVRGTFTHYNTDFSKDVLHLANEGFKEISVEPVVASYEQEYALTENDLQTIYDQYDKLAKEMLKREEQGNGFNFYHYAVDLNGGPCIYKRLLGCGSGTEYLAVTPWGDLYPCHQFVGIDEFLLGNLDEGIVNTCKQKEFEKCNVYTKPKCKECWAKFYCSGGCLANAYQLK